MFSLLLLAACVGGESGGSFGIDGDVLDTGSDIDVDAIVNGFTARCDEADLTVTALADGVVHLRYGDEPARPSWAVVGAGAAETPPEIVVYSDLVAFRTDELAVLVERGTCRLIVEDTAGAVLLDEPVGGGFDDTPVGTRLTRMLTADEHIYGLGERTGGVDRRGREYTCWNTDAFDAAYGGWAPDADPLYQCIPFYVSLREGAAFGVFTDVTWRSTLDVGAADADEMLLEVPAGGTLEQYLLPGPSLATVVRRYTGLTGRPPLPPRWTLGFHQSRWGWSPDTAVTDVVDGFRARDLPLDAAWLDIQHMDGFRSFTWDPVTFPDPAGLVADLAADGVRTVTIVDPAIKVDSTWDIYTDGVAAGHFLLDDGGPWVGEVWPGDSVFPDFTNPSARTWWGGLSSTDLGYGVAGLWLDMNEPAEFTEGTVPDDLPVHGDGVSTTMAEVHNVYALAEAEATYEGWRALRPDTRPFLLTRAGYAGIQRYAAAWTGDAPSTWESLAGTLPMLLGMSVSGESFVGSDVGGYSGGASGELYARWLQVGAFSPFFRAHLVSGAADQYPWSFGQEVLDISRATLQLRYTLLPYLYSLAWEATRSGAPPLRPLVWEWPADATAVTLGDQALLGPWLMVAPVLEEGATTRVVYLPEGRWFDFYTGVVHDGPATVTFTDLPLAALPIFVREGAILPRGPAGAFSDAAPLDPLTLEVWPGPAATTFTVYEDAGDGFDYADGGSSAVTWTLQGVATGAVLEASARVGTWAPPDRDVRVRVRRVDSPPTAVRLDGAALTEVANEAALTPGAWWWDAVDLSLWVVLEDDADLALAFDYDPTLVDPAPPVAMPLRVTVPEGTPTDTAIHVASSVDAWASHTPLAWVSPTEAYGTIEVPRGQFVYYKYTRGGWDTVEKWPDCVEAGNRYELGRAQEKRDTVYGWRDQCPE